MDNEMLQNEIHSSKFVILARLTYGMTSALPSIGQSYSLAREIYG